ncbi:MAG: DNA-binding protein [Candidatus Liptonbacteria bacterium]|nr:DNA-binding protein [Candidatus Liptonbacteria bacterium]
MRQILKDGAVYILRFDKGEEVLTGLIAFARQMDIHAGTFSGIGAASRVALSYYDFEKKEYLSTELREVEIASLTGNIGILKGEIAIHAHGVFSGRDMAAKAGHVKEIVVSGTCEMRFEALAGKLERAHDATTGLNLIQ